jgi:hypothetical protein
VRVRDRHQDGNAAIAHEIAAFAVIVRVITVFERISGRALVRGQRCFHHTVMMMVKAGMSLAIAMARSVGIAPNRMRNDERKSHHGRNQPSNAALSMAEEHAVMHQLKGMLRCSPKVFN